MSNSNTPNKPRKKARVYFKQYDTVWSMTYIRALVMIDLYLGGENYNLDKYGVRIKPRPQIKFQTYHCIDFDLTDWKECKRDIEIANGVSNG